MGGGQRLGSLNHQMILYEKAGTRSTAGVNVLFSDGSAQLVPVSALQSQLNATAPPNRLSGNQAGPGGSSP